MKIFSEAGVTRYEIRTKQMFFRGGRSYSEDKIIEVISGTVWLLIPRDISEEDFPFLEKNKRKLEALEDDEVDYTFILPQISPIVIPANIPHIFYSETDSYFTEYFPETAKTAEYYRYRVMKEISPQ